MLPENTEWYMLSLNVMSLSLEVRGVASEQISQTDLLLGFY